ncbi:hypothetical protein BdWA1_002866 [Babesia duncani]|uniref:Uncharacterized protein n=1 Tax=Babesia duncani TaxID=323732 RepID=A0AAD9PIU4_9APIC|nr:hypothetical protein BdWA1_002866 [Babesia duncani]
MNCMISSFSGFLGKYTEAFLVYYKSKGAIQVPRKVLKNTFLQLRKKIPDYVYNVDGMDMSLIKIKLKVNSTLNNNVTYTTNFRPEEKSFKCTHRTGICHWEEMNFVSYRFQLFADGQVQSS